MYIFTFVYIVSLYVIPVWLLKELVDYLVETVFYLSLAYKVVIVQIASPRHVLYLGKLWFFTG